jgi:hypothetical protein
MQALFRRIMLSSTSIAPWYASLPAPQAAPLQMAVSELKALIDDSKKRAGVAYVVVDVRRADMDVSPTETWTIMSCFMRSLTRFGSVV